MNEKIERPAFTLRFRREATHRALRRAAEELGISMNEFAERAIKHELAVVGHELEEKLRTTAKLLRPYREEQLEAAIQAVARAEAEHDDPVRATAVETGGLMDPAGIGELFGHSVES